MKCVIPEISWHNREPVLCIDVHPINKEDHYKIATGGADYHILVWNGTIDEKGGVCVQVASDLTRHQKAVNALRWSPDGAMLASADDDAIIFVWTQKAETQEAKSNKESYVVHKILRGHKEDIYDLCWSPKSDKIVTGSIDNSAILWDVTKGKCENIFADHKGFVQGVCWDPKGQYIATLSSDRTCRIFDVATRQLRSRILKGFLPVPESHPFHNKEVKYFHDDTFKSYYRRFGFSPDGNLFIAPAGFVETDDNKTMKCAYMFTLDNPQPVGIFPFDNYCTVVAKFSPSLYELLPLGPDPYINLPYRMVFAIAAETDILLYDTQQAWPFGRLKNVHYTKITDLSWSSDGRLLVAASSDGYCTLLSFAPGEIGELYVKEETEEEKENSNLNISGIEELEPTDNEEIKESNGKEMPVKKPTFLLQWAHKARDGIKVINDIAKSNISEDAINVLTVRRAPKADDGDQDKEVAKMAAPTKGVKRKSTTPAKQENNVIPTEQDDPSPSKPEKPIRTQVRTIRIVEEIPKPLGEVIEIEDSPIKRDSKIPSPRPKRVVPKLNIRDELDKKSEDVHSRTAGAKPIAIRRKPHQETTPNKKGPKPNPLLKFLTTSPEKKMKPIIEDAEARDSWKCDNKPGSKPEPVKLDTVDDISVPDLDLKIENSTQSTPAAAIILSDASGDSDGVVPSQTLKPVHKQSNSSHGTQTENSGVAPVNKKTPRRVSLITLSSPKHTKQKNP